MEDATSLAQPSTKRVPTLLKVYAVILIIVSVLAIPLAALTAVVLPQVQVESHYGVTSIVIIAVSLVLSLAEAVIGIILGANLLRNNRRGARRAIEFLIVADLAIILCDIMISGLSGISVAMVVRLAFYIALMVYIDPSLAEERQLKRKLSNMETRERAELGTLGRDESGKGYIELDFFNLFWIFMVCCVLGLLIEAVYHMVVVDPGVYQNRAGMLYGPFSPIYGFGAVLMTLALNRFYNKNIVLIFLMSAVIGGAFEYFVSWFMQFAFGIVAWDYSGTFLSIDGRTNGMFMAMWGVLGCVWIKFCLPHMLKLVNRIPWNWRYTVTTICTALMLLNGAMTLLSLDCWYQREAGQQPENAMEQFFADHYDNAFMAERFQSMSIDPSNTTRAQ